MSQVSDKQVAPWVWGVLGMLILGLMLATLRDPGHHLPGTPGYGSPAPSVTSSVTSSVTPHK